MYKVMKLDEYSTGGKFKANPESLEIDTKILDDLVELVGSEEEVEEAAKIAFEELAESFEKGEIEFNEQPVPENLALASLVVKLVELGKLGPDEADDFIEKAID